MRAKVKPTENYDYKMYVALRQGAPVKPPYEADFEVTPESKFGDDIWVEPAEAFAAGHSDRNTFDFYRRTKVSGQAKYSFTECDRTLVRQFKECVVSFKFNRAHLSRRRQIVSPRTVFRDAEILSVLFANLAFSGVTTLGELTPDLLSHIFRSLPNSDGTHDKLVQYFQDVVILSRKGLITDGAVDRNFTVELRDNDPPVKPIARTLEDEETSFLIKHALFYIDNAEMLISKLGEYRRGLVPSPEMRAWMLRALPIVSMGHAAYGEQLITMIRVSSYIVIAFHLGSRISEVLSADGDFATGETDELSKLEKVIAKLTVFKGKRGGKEREYEVHPYILRVAAVLRNLNSAIGLDGDGLLFRKKDGEFATTVNNMNAKLKRFALLHGATFTYTSHSLRYSLADIVMGALDHPFSAIQRRLGHKFITQSVAYGANGPAGEEIKKAAAQAAAKAISRFVERIDYEDQLGGLQGQRISEAMQSGATKQEIAQELDEMGVVPVEVNEDEFCLKTQQQRGACSSLTGDTLPEPEGCTAACQFQVQFPSWSAPRLTGQIG